MKRIMSFALVIVLFFSFFTVGIIEIGKFVADEIECRQVRKMYYETTALSGEIENRVAVVSKKKLDDQGAFQKASGYDDLQIFQFETREQAEKAYAYYNSLDYVESVDYDRKLTLCGDEILDNDDAKCYSTAASNIDDMIKLIKENYSDLPEIRIGVIDTGCEENDLTRGVVENLGNTVGADNDHGTKICGTIIYNTMGNVKIFSYDCGDADGISHYGATTAMNMATANDKCKILNMSYGSYETSTTQQNAINNAYNRGAIMVAAAGNERTQLTSSVKTYPCCYDKVIGIGSLSPDRTKASYSNYGTGVNYFTVGSTVRSFQDGSDIYWNGTSAATPMALSIFVNMLSVNSSLKTSTLKSYIVTEYSHEDNNSYSYIDGYASLCKLIGKELPQADFTYDLEKNETTGFSKITFHCDEGVRIYCKLNSNSTIAINNSTKSEDAYYNGDTLELESATTVNAVACGDKMRKSKDKIINAPSYNEDDYTFNSTTSTLSRCQLIDSKIIKVPSEIDGKTVTAIGADCFAGNQSVETIVLPSSIETIGGYAFANCPNLKKVIAPNVTECGRYALENCNSLLFVYMPNARNLYNGALRDCEALTAVDLSSDYETLHHYNGVFKNTENIIDYHQTSHKYVVENYAVDGTVTYKCPDCKKDERISLSADVLLEMWHPCLVNKYINTKTYDSKFLFDVTGDGIINAKDYSVIHKLSKNI